MISADQAPPTIGDIAQTALVRQPEVVEFLSGVFGPYPFSSAGAIIDLAFLGFALETQTRPVYDPGFFTSPEFAASVVVHEYAHQWVGDLLPVAAWRRIWLNEGFATYAEWLWSEHDGHATAQEQRARAAIRADDPLWSVTIGDPGVDAMFDGAVYDGRAMTLHALRLLVGDEAFFRIVRE